jgi:hypothetical protein
VGDPPCSEISSRNRVRQRKENDSVGRCAHQEIPTDKALRNAGGLAAQVHFVPSIEVLVRNMGPELLLLSVVMPLSRAEILAS